MSASATTKDTSGFAEVSGARLYYEASGAGPPLILIHAGIADSRMWAPQIPAFSARYRVIRYDLRGFGKSAPTPGAFSHSRDLAALMDVLGVDKAHVVGLSMGGGAALDLALSRPERVRGLVLAAPAVGGFETSEAVRRAYEEVERAFKAGDIAGAVEAELRLWVDGPRRAPGEIPPAIRELVRIMDTDILAQDPGVDELEPLDPPTITRLGDVRAPVLTITGDIDVPEAIERTDIVAERIPGARKAVLSGAAHMMTMEQPDAFNRLVLDFLADVEARGL